MSRRRRRAAPGRGRRNCGPWRATSCSPAAGAIPSVAPDGLRGGAATAWKAGSATSGGPSSSFINGLRIFGGLGRGDERPHAGDGADRVAFHFRAIRVRRRSASSRSGSTALMGGGGSIGRALPQAVRIVASGLFMPASRASTTSPLAFGPARPSMVAAATFAGAAASTLLNSSAGRDSPSPSGCRSHPARWRRPSSLRGPHPSAPPAGPRTPRRASWDPSCPAPRPPSPGSPSTDPSSRPAPRSARCRETCSPVRPASRAPRDGADRRASCRRPRHPPALRRRRRCRAERVEGQLRRGLDRVVGIVLAQQQPRPRVRLPAVRTDLARGPRGDRRGDGGPVRRGRRDAARGRDGDLRARRSRRRAAPHRPRGRRGLHGGGYG